MVRVTRSIGTGLSERTSQAFDLSRSSQGEFDKFADEVNAAAERPWRWHAGAIAAARRAYQDARAAEPDIFTDLTAYNAYYCERATQAWYLKEIAARATAAEAAIERGDPWEAVQDAMHIGELFSELRLKFGSDWERAALIGQPMIANGQSRRRGQQNDRVSAVDALVARGLSVTKAFATVAADEGSHPRTVETDYYKARKTS